MGLAIIPKDIIHLHTGTIWFSASCTLYVNQCFDCTCVRTACGFIYSTHVFVCQRVDHKLRWRWPLTSDERWSITKFESSATELWDVIIDDSLTVTLWLMIILYQSLVKLISRENGAAFCRSRIYVIAELTSTCIMYIAECRMSYVAEERTEMEMRNSLALAYSAPASASPYSVTETLSSPLMNIECSWKKNRESRSSNWDGAMWIECLCACGMKNFLWFCIYSIHPST